MSRNSRLVSRLLRTRLGASTFQPECQVVNHARSRFSARGFTTASMSSDNYTAKWMTPYDKKSPQDLIARVPPIEVSGRVVTCEGACLYKQRRWHTSGVNFDGKEKISVTFVSKDGEEQKIQVPVGMSMLEAAHENDIELEGACEGSLACSTCHVIVMDEEMYNQLPEPSDEENDMLDLAFGLTETSRLGCQVIAKPELDGLQLALPAATRNFAVDGHVPKPH